MKQKGQKLKLPNQPCLVIFDRFKAQCTSTVLEVLEENNIFVSLILANCTDWLLLQIERIRKRGSTRHLLKAIVQSRANHNTYSYNHIIMIYYIPPFLFNPQSIKYNNQYNPIAS